jgi:hypothetical protein
MSPEEAIRRIKNHNEVHSRKEKHFAVHITEALNMAVDALEKQIPKKIENAHVIWNRFDAIDHWEGSCPNCKTNIRFSVDVNYCFYCGQALDWSDIE